MAKFRFVCIIPKREVELAEAAIVLDHCRDRRLTYTEFHTMLGKGG